MCAAYLSIVLLAWQITDLTRRSAVTASEFNVLFDQACRTHGAGYSAARDRLVAAVQEAPSLRESLRDLVAAPLWEQRLTVEILLGWVDHRPLFEKCSDFLTKDLPGMVPMTGYIPVIRGQAIAGLGPTVTPRVLELLWKIPEPLSSAASEALFAALKNLKDARSVGPMMKIAREGSLPDRRDALSVLSAIGDIRGLDVALAALGDPSVRLAAIQSLAGFADSRATAALLNCLRDVALPPAERKAAARALIKQSSRDQAASVSNLLRDERDPEVRLLLIILLGRIGTQSDIGLLESLKVDQREEIVEAISDAVAEIRERVNPQ